MRCMLDDKGTATNSWILAASPINSHKIGMVTAKIHIDLGSLQIF